MLNKLKIMILKWLGVGQLISSVEFDNKIKALQDNVNAITLAHNMLNQEYKGLQEQHNKLGCDVTLLMNVINKNELKELISKHINLSN